VVVTDAVRRSCPAQSPPADSAAPVRTRKNLRGSRSDAQTPRDDGKAEADRNQASAGQRRPEGPNRRLVTASADDGR